MWTEKWSTSSSVSAWPAGNPAQPKLFAKKYKKPNLDPKLLEAPVVYMIEG